MNYKTFVNQVLHVVYPHRCEACGGESLSYTEVICARCLHHLPHTGFQLHAGNPVEKIFQGRINIAAAHSEFYFTKGKKVQHLIHALKYNANFEVGELLGQLLAKSLLSSGRFASPDLLVPLPLNKKKEAQRGFNQALILCNAMSKVLGLPVMKDNLIRERFTETQTRKHRMERWQNVDGSFRILNAAGLENKHVLLVDDVLTTGASLEAAGIELLKVPGCILSLSTVAFAGK